MSSYLDHGQYPANVVFPTIKGHSWIVFTYDRLLWLYNDPRRAGGLTPTSLADQASWRALGRRSAA